MSCVANNNSDNNLFNNKMDWLTEIKNAKKTSIVHNNVRKVHYLFTNNKEMAEEYNMDTECLIKRAWKIGNDLGGEGIWEVEIGEPEPTPQNESTTTIAESSNQPFITRRITKRNMEWRIRNLPYPIETYSVTADTDNNSIIVKTSNKKYYKKLDIPELKRVKLRPQQAYLEFTHKYNTLIITYKKPQEMINLDNAVLNEIKQLKPVSFSEKPDNCKPS